VTRGELNHVAGRLRQILQEQALLSV
jgi:hypothetical protein